MMSFHQRTFSTSPSAASAAAATTSPAHSGARAVAPSDTFASRRMPSSARSRVAAFAAARRARMREVRQPSARANRTDRKSVVPGVPSESANARVAANATTLPEDTTPAPRVRTRCPRAVSSATFAETAHAPATRLCAGPAGPSASTRSASSSRESPSAAHDPRGARSPMNPSDADAMRTSHPTTRSRRSVASTPAATATATAPATTAATNKTRRTPPITRARRSGAPRASASDVEHLRGDSYFFVLGSWNTRQTATVASRSSRFFATKKSLIQSSVFIGGAFANSKNSDELEAVRASHEVHRFEMAHVRHI